MKIKQRTAGYVSQRYYTEKKKLEKNGKDGCCIICGKKLPKYRRKYCSDKCFNGWFEQFQPKRKWPEIRRKVFKRDRFQCVKCGKKDGKDRNKDGYPTCLVADHIIPIALGGDEFDIKNIQTLCEDCHKVKTRQDIKLIAIARKIPEDQVKLSELNNPSSIR